MTPLLGLLKNPLVSGGGAMAIIVLMVALFVRDMRRIRRGEPIKTLYRPEKIYPGDQWWAYAVVIYLGPYIAFICLVTVLLGAFALTRIFPPHP
jgi:hypothetical protein